LSREKDHGDNQDRSEDTAPHSVPLRFGAKALVLIAQLYPLRARAITAYRINQLSPDRFKDFWRWFRKFFTIFAGGNTRAIGRANFWRPTPQDGSAAELRWPRATARPARS
jgi:hypothetical protein